MILWLSLYWAVLAARDKSSTVHTVVDMENEKLPQFLPIYRKVKGRKEERKEGE